MATKSDLPIPDYDHLPVGSLASRIRSLSAAEVAELISFEEQHGARVPVLQVLRARRDQLDAGEQPTEGDPNGPNLEASSAQGGSMVSPATQGPKLNPPSHGDPTNPVQETP